MKKIFLLLAFAGTAAFTSCTSDDDGRVYNDSDTISEVIETPPLTFNAAGEFSKVVEFNGPTYDSDVVLVYRLTTDGNINVWQQIPRTIFLNTGGEVDYDFNFTEHDVRIFMLSNDLADLNNLPALTNNQVFRIVRVPGYFVNGVDVNNYDAVMSAITANGNEVPVIEQ